MRRQPSLPFVNPYEVLSLPVGVSVSVVKQRYRQLVLACHPDQHPNNTNATQTLQRLNEAYTFLRDTTKKKHLDTLLTRSFKKSEKNHKQSGYSVTLRPEEAQQGCVKTVPVVWQATCHRCHAKRSHCSVCNGSGVQCLQREVTVKIPPGVIQGAVIRFAKQGPPHLHTGDPTDLQLHVLINTE